MQILCTIFNVCFLILNITLGIFFFNKYSEQKLLGNKLKTEMGLKNLKFTNFKIENTQAKDLFTIFNDEGKIISYTRNENIVSEINKIKYVLAVSIYFMNIEYIKFLSKLQYINNNALAFSVNKLIIESKDPLPPLIYLKIISLTYEEI
jgi:hypothetical protein